jgi:ribosomal protein S18 acetylase RimI-like enzyme
MKKELEKQCEVRSSNLKSIGFYKKPTNSIIKIEFQRGAIYEYYPCNEKEFQEAFAPGVVLKDWFAKFKVGKNYTQK